MTTCFSARSGASKLRSSTTRSRIVCRRRAPMFWVERLTWKAKSAIASMASGGELDVDPLGARAGPGTGGSARRGARGGSGRSRRGSGLAARRGSGTGPEARASGREGLERWKAPAAMNRTWSVFTGPYLVVTVVPSTIGSRSRWTPWRETSGPLPPPPSSPAILSISSRKTMPDSSASATAAWLTFSGSIRASVSCASRIGPGLGDGQLAGLRRLGDDLLEHPLEVHLHLLHVRPRRGSRPGPRARPGRVISTSRSSSSPASSRAFIFSREPLPALGRLVGLGRVRLDPGGVGGGGQEQVEQPLLGPRLGLVGDPLALARP